MKLNQRGQIVFAVSLIFTASALLLGLFWLVDHVNWVGDGYCFKASIDCYFPEEGR